MRGTNDDHYSNLTPRLVKEFSFSFKDHADRSSSCTQTYNFLIKLKKKCTIYGLNRLTLDSVFPPVTAGQPHLLLSNSNELAYSHGQI